MNWLARLLRPRAAVTQATDADVYFAYRLLLLRQPDRPGLEHHKRRVSAGLPLAELVNDFLRSDEFHDRMEAERLSELRRVDLGGYELLVPSADPDFGAIIASYRTYEEPVREAMRANLSAGDVCLDVGANIGVMTFLASSIVGPGGLVVAVEPNPDNVQLLYRTMHLTGASNVLVLPVAASDGRRVFSLRGRSNTELVPPREAGTGGGLFVQSVALDDLLDGLPRLDLVKMDIEGHEPAALRGLARVLARHRPVLLVEFNPARLAAQGQDALAYLELLFDLHPRVRARSAYGDDELFARADDLWAFWVRRSEALASAGTIDEGALHFDLITARAV